MREDLSLLRERRFASLFAVRTLSMLGLAFAPVALAFGAVSYTHLTLPTNREV